VSYFTRFVARSRPMGARKSRNPLFIEVAEAPVPSIPAPAGPPTSTHHIPRATQCPPEGLATSSNRTAVDGLDQTVRIPFLPSEAASLGRRERPAGPTSPDSPAGFVREGITPLPTLESSTSGAALKERSPGHREAMPISPAANYDGTPPPRGSQPVFKMIEERGSGGADVRTSSFHERVAQDLAPVRIEASRKSRLQNVDVRIGSISIEVRRPEPRIAPPPPRRVSSKLDAGVQGVPRLSRLYMREL
jgi:hypothetical protein